MARTHWCVVGAAAVAACTLLDSVDGYEGPGTSAGAGGVVDAGSDGGAAGAGAGSGGGGTAGGCSLGSCDDGNRCTDDACWGGQCVNTPIDPSSIPDDDSCTIDSCDPKAGIQHVMPTDPAPVVLQCGSIVCPAGYYVRKLTCLAECGDCDPTYCVNGVSCQRACEPQITVCCGNDCEQQDCPSGYSMGAQSSIGDCGCGPGKAMLCTR